MKHELFRQIIRQGRAVVHTVTSGKYLEDGQGLFEETTKLHHLLIELYEEIGPEQPTHHKVMNEKTPANSATTICFLCEKQLFVGIMAAEADNFRGHDAHEECIKAELEKLKYRKLVTEEDKEFIAAALKTGQHSAPGPVGEPGEKGEVVPGGCGPTPPNYGVPAVPRMWDSPITTETGPFAPENPPPAPANGVAITLEGDSVVMFFPPELINDSPNAQDILEECHFVTQLLLTKNRAYGSSFAKPLGVFSKLSPVEAINARMDDKLARIMQAKDFTEDTELDLIGYLILKRVAMKLDNPNGASYNPHFKVHMGEITEILNTMSEERPPHPDNCPHRIIHAPTGDCCHCGKNVNPPTTNTYGNVCCSTGMTETVIGGKRVWKCFKCGNIRELMPPVKHDGVPCFTSTPAPPATPSPEPR